MPKLRPLKRKEDIEKVPLTEPVAIELDDADPATELLNEAAAKAQETEPKPAPRAEPEPEPIVEPEPEPALVKQLEELRRSEKEAQRQAQEAQRKLQEREAEFNRKISESDSRTEQAQYDAVLNAIGAAQTEAEAAQRDLEVAMSVNDTKSAAEAQRKLARAEARLVSLEDGKAAYEAKREETKKVPPQQPQQADPFEAHISQIAINDRERGWMREHKDYLMDARKNARLSSAHYDAEDAGLRRGTDQYLEFIEEKLGLREPPLEPETRSEPPRRSPNVSAPPSRQAPSASTGKTTPTRIELNAAQREAARIAGIDDITYAKNVLKLQQLKSEGHYQDRG